MDHLLLLARPKGILKKILPFKGRGMHAEEKAAFGKTAFADFASARYKFEGDFIDSVNLQNNKNIVKSFDRLGFIDF